MQPKTYQRLLWHDFPKSLSKIGTIRESIVFILSLAWTVLKYLKKKKIGVPAWLSW